MLKFDVRRLSRSCEAGECRCDGEDHGMLLDFLCACDCHAHYDPWFPTLPLGNGQKWLETTNGGVTMPISDWDQRVSP